MFMDRSTWNVIQLGIGMCLVFFAFTSQGFIVETVLENRHKTDPKISENAGYYSQTVIYGCFVISNIIAPPIVKLLTPKWSLVFGSSAYTLYMVGFEFINPYYLYISAAYEGLCAGVMWTAMGHYLAINSTSATIGRNSGMVWLIYSSSYIFGGIFLLIMFGNSPDTSISMKTTRELYGAFSGVALCGNIVFALLQNPPKATENAENTVKSGSVDTENSSYLYELKKSWDLFLTFDLVLLIAVFGFSGMELSFWSGVYSTALSFTKKFTINTNRLMALNSIAVGIGEISGGLVFGLFGNRTNRYGRYPIVILGVVVGIISYILTFINLPGVASYEETQKTSFIQPSIPIALSVGVMLGFTDACINTQIYSLLTVRYEGQTTQAFALHKLFHALLSTICMFYGSVLQLGWQLLLLTIGGILSAITFTIVERRYIQKQRKSEEAEFTS